MLNYSVSRRDRICLLLCPFPFPFPYPVHVVYHTCVCYRILYKELQLQTIPCEVELIYAIPGMNSKWLLKKPLLPSDSYATLASVSAYNTRRHLYCTRFLQEKWAQGREAVLARKLPRVGAHLSVRLNYPRQCRIMFQHIQAVQHCLKTEKHTVQHCSVELCGCLAPWVYVWCGVTAMELQDAKKEEA